MKKIYTLVATLLLAAGAYAQAPNMMSYQAVVRNSNNTLVINQSIGMQITILQGSASGVAVYTEEHTPNSNANGLVTVKIGTGAVVSGDFSTIDWSAGPFYIKTETDPNGGVSYSIASTSQLMSVPYALYAANSGSSTPGPQGAAGPQGVVGPTGVQGVQGLAGADGADGSGVTIQGSDTYSTILSLTGTTGDMWIVSADASPNASEGDGMVWDGTTWNNVGPIRGPQGIQGIQGLTGTTGAQGLIGATGNDGNDGAVGPTGSTGAQGIQGLTGAQGQMGANGTDGQDGAQGIQGLTGATGAQGTQGIQGVAGADGADGSGVTIQGTDTYSNILLMSATSGDMWIVSVDASPNALEGDGMVWDGTVWNNVGPIRGPQGPQGLVGATGTQGAQGLQGATGATGAIGATGLTGAQGLQGVQGLTGAQGTAGADGSDGATGATGAQGAQGIQGTTGATGAMGATGAAGPTGSQGIQGLTGATGPQGPAGPSQTLSISGSALTISGGNTVTLPASSGGAFSTATGVTSNSNGTYATDDFVFGSSQLDNASGSSDDARMFFDKGKSAFRAGDANSTQWDNANLGEYSTAFGTNTTASGQVSLATGYSSVASGDYSMALGGLATAEGDHSMAIGLQTKATSDYTVAIGRGAEARRYASVAISPYSLAIGSGATALGYKTTAQARYMTAVGVFNVPMGDSVAWVATDPVFAVGNGNPTSVNPSTALTVLKNGNTGFGVLDPDATVEINGQIKVTGGNPGAGKVLTSDAAGLASWVTPASGGGGGTDDQTIDYMDLSGTLLRISLEDDGQPVQTVDLAPLQDGNTQLNESQVDAFVANNGYLTSDSDNQTLDVSSLNGTDLQLSLSGDGQATKIIDLSPLQDGFEANTDGQTLSISGNSLTIAGGNTVTLPSGGGGGTDDQNLTGATLVGTTLQISIENGSSTSVNLSGLQDGNTQLNESQVDAFVANNGYLTSETDGSTTNELQTLSLSGTMLGISSKNTVNLASLQDGFEANTDGQTLTLSGNNLSISGGNSVTLPSGGGGTDDQVVDNFSLSGSTLRLSLENDGNPLHTVDLSGIGVSDIDGLTDAQNNGYDLFLGDNAGANQSGLNSNIGIGRNSLTALTFGSSNIAMGIDALKSVTTSVYNIAIGEKALQNNTSNFNIAIGRQASGSLTTGSANVVIGQNANFWNTTGVDNVVIGDAANGHNSSGSRNVMLGTNSGYKSSGNTLTGCVYIGDHSGENTTVDNRLIIDNSNTITPLIYGEFDNDIVKINGTLKITEVMNLKPLAAAPAGVKGDMYTGTNGKLYFHNGVAWKEIVLL